jgi:hypothetical protein
MAKTAEDIKFELKESIQITDKTLDVEQGPIPDIFINPQSGQLANASEDAESLRQLFTLQFSTVATDDEVRKALANYGSTPGGGTKSSHIQHFLRFTRPTVDILVPSGTLISNVGGDLVYRVVSGGTIVATSASSYYNANRRAYEIGLLVEAVGIGEKYNLPENRVIGLTTPVTGIDATENRTKSTGGKEAETKESQSNRLKNSLLGINLGAPGGIQTQIKNALPELISDTAVIQPFEKEFKRLTSGPALDLYCIGNNTQSYTQTYVAAGGETQVILDKKPVIGILSLTVNNVSGIAYTLIKDTTLETGYSLQAVDYIILSTALGLGDTVVVQYTYNKTLEDVYSYVYASGNTYLFKTDILIRQPFYIPPVLGGEIQALASYSVTEVENNVLNFFSTEFTFTTFIEMVYPEVIRQRVLTEVSGVQNFKLTEFRRSSGSLSTIEPIQFARNEIATFDTTYYKIKVVS